MPENGELTAPPIQLVVNTDALLAQIGWTTTHIDYDGDPYTTTETVDMKRDLASMVAQILADRLHREMIPVVRDAVKEAAQERVAAIVADAMAQGFRKTNTYGEPTGEPITMREMVIGEVKGQMERRVTRNGNAAERYDSGALPYVQYVAAKAAQEALNGELKAAATAAVDEVKGSVKALVAEELGAKIAKIVAAR